MKKMLYNNKIRGQKCEYVYGKKSEQLKIFQKLHRPMPFLPRFTC